MTASHNCTFREGGFLLLLLLLLLLVVVALVVSDMGVLLALPALLLLVNKLSFGSLGKASTQA